MTVRAAEDADHQRQRIYQTTTPSLWPLLGVPVAATRKQVMSAFRRRARELHPDAGGDAAAFRALVAEKDRALMAA